MQRSSARYLPSTTLVLTLLLTVYFLAVYRPLASRVRAENGPLVSVWTQLVRTNAACVACAGLELGAFDARLQELRLAATNLAESSRLILDRIEPAPKLQDRLSQPWRLNDFENERGILVEKLTGLAKQRGVRVDGAALAGVPAYAVDVVRPILLWARMHQAEQLLVTAMECKVSAVKSLTQLPAVSHRAATNVADYLEELPMRIELEGSTESLARYLTTLPLRGDELSTVGLPASLTNKPVLFLDRVLLRKSAPDRPGDVLADLRISGLVPVREPRGDSVENN